MLTQLQAMDNYLTERANRKGTLRNPPASDFYARRNDYYNILNTFITNIEKAKSPQEREAAYREFSIELERSAKVFSGNYKKHLEALKQYIDTNLTDIAQDDKYVAYLKHRRDHYGAQINLQYHMGEFSGKYGIGPNSITRALEAGAQTGHLSQTVITLTRTMRLLNQEPTELKLSNVGVGSSTPLLQGVAEVVSSPEAIVATEIELLSSGGTLGRRGEIAEGLHKLMDPLVTRAGEYRASAPRGGVAKNVQIFEEMAKKRSEDKQGRKQQPTRGDTIKEKLLAILDPYIRELDKKPTIENRAAQQDAMALKSHIIAMLEQRQVGLVATLDNLLDKIRDELRINESLNRQLPILANRLLPTSGGLYDVALKKLFWATSDSIADLLKEAPTHKAKPG